MKIIALCHTCARRHAIDFDPVAGPGAAFSDWITKHPEPHLVDFVYPQRSAKRVEPDAGWEHYLHNADVKVAYAASAALTITLESGGAGLGASSSLLAGRESSSVTNTSNLYLDYLLSGFYTTNSTNIQAGRIRTAVVGRLDDTTWPDVFDGTDSAETVSSADIFNSVCRVVSEIVTDTTARTYPFGPTAIAGLFGGAMPGAFVVFVAHNAQTSTNEWGDVGGNHAVYQKGVYATVA